MYLGKKESLAISGVVGLKVAVVKVAGVLDGKVTVYPTIWSEGRKTEYFFVNLANMEVVNFTPSTDYYSNPSKYASGLEIVLPTNIGMIMVEYSGSEKYVSLVVRNENMPRNALPLREVLTWEELAALYIARSTKSSHREQEAVRLGMGRSYHSAKETLMEKGLLSKKGAINLSGRNAIATLEHLPSREAWKR